MRCAEVFRIPNLSFRACEESPCEALDGEAGAWCVVRSVGLRPMRFARGPFADAQGDGPWEGGNHTMRWSDY